MEYQVKLDSFQGPLDLLLYLVKRQEIDICDIPIAKVAEQFMEYLRVLEMVDVERAADFLVMAATLMEIKSRALLPRSEDGADEEEDPRLELVEQLLEYKRFKDAAALLEAREERQICLVPRSPSGLSMGREWAEQPLKAVELWDLVSAFSRLLRETMALEPQQIVVDETPTQVYQDQIMEILSRQGQVPFATVFAPPRTRARLVGIFLAILELIKSGLVVAEQGSEEDVVVLTRRLTT
jgi:segregation and condensation protein A